MNKKISIIVPIYGVEEYLSRCIESILSQTYKNLQIILVDDGSKDNSGKISDEYAAKDSRIEVIHQSNAGLVAARKRGLKIADGDYIGFVDGDDYIEPEMYSRLAYIINEFDADFVHSGYKKNDYEDTWGTCETSVINLNRKNVAVELNRLVFDIKERQVMTACLCMKLFRTSIIKKAYSIVPDNQSYGEDLLALTKCFFISSKMVILNESYYHYRIRKSSITNNVEKKMLSRERQLHQCLERLIIEEGTYEILHDAIDTYWLTGIIDDLKKIIFDGIRVFNCSYIEKLRGKKIVIYGAGAVGEDYYAQLRLYRDIDIVFWVDKNYQNIKNNFCKIDSPEVIKSAEFDYIVIAMQNPNLAYDIILSLKENGIPENKIVWESPTLSSVIS